MLAEAFLVQSVYLMRSLCDGSSQIEWMALCSDLGTSWKTGWSTLNGHINSIYVDAGAESILHLPDSEHHSVAF